MKRESGTMVSKNRGGGAMGRPMEGVLWALAKFVATFAVGLCAVAMGIAAIFRFFPCWAGGRCVTDYPGPGRLQFRRGK